MNTHAEVERLDHLGIIAGVISDLKLGRALDDCHAYGCDLLFAEVSAKICKAEGVDTKFNSLDTTAFALTGDYNVDSDEHTIENKCHWIADVIFKEDDIVMDRGNSAENLGLFRRLAMNMAVVADPERGLAAVRRAATFGSGYLKGILATFFCQNLSNNFS